MKNTKKKIEKEEKNKSVSRTAPLEVQDDFSDMTDWESEISLLQGRSFDSIDDALIAFAEASVRKATPGPITNDQIEFVVSMLKDNETICEFLRKQLLIKK